MTTEEMKLLAAMLEQAARHLVDLLFEKIRNAGKDAWGAIREAAAAALAWITAACKAVGRQAREFVVAAGRKLKEIVAKLQALLAKIGLATA